jgi:hypothetical protein
MRYDDSRTACRSWRGGYMKRFNARYFICNCTQTGQAPFLTCSLTIVFGLIKMPDVSEHKNKELGLFQNFSFGTAPIIRNYYEQ